MQVEVVLPHLDDAGTTVFTVERWLCSEGVRVRKDEPLLQVRSPTTVHLVPAPVDGLVVVLRVEAGEKVRRGAVLAVLDTGTPS